ncbi:MAG: DUF2892 domain-containing protein [Flavobacteriales bacterium]|jgi:uncharacterized membrane protein YccC|nr:DUF2892 domain-containing protein [Flavobacteriales bacterium]
MILTVRARPSPDLCTSNNEEMKPNMGNTDRLLRTIAAIVIAVLYFTGVLHGTVGIVLLVLAAMLLLTGWMRFCPLYPLFGLDTRKKTA